MLHRDIGLIISIYYIGIEDVLPYRLALILEHEFMFASLSTQQKAMTFDLH